MERLDMDKAYEIFVGTYTMDTLSKGIYRCFLDSDGKLIKISAIDNDENPSFVCLSGDAKTLYALAELEDRGAVTSYDIEGLTPTLKEKINVGGSLMCHISTTSIQDNILCACYKSGDIYSLLLGGSPKILSQINKSSEKGQSSSHFISIDKSGKYALTVDIALDCIHVYRYSNGCLEQPDNGFFKLQLECGEGPRHLKFHPYLDTVYVTTEYSNKIITLRFDDATGTLEFIRSDNMLPDDHKGASCASEIAISKDGMFLYAANRGANLITCFELDNSGQLVLRGHFDCFGDWPRHIYITGDSKFMLVANQNSGNVAVMPVSSSDGALSAAVEEISIPSPVCLCERIHNL
jgi:6-phosphogluconolactonase